MGEAVTTVLVEMTEDSEAWEAERHALAGYEGRRRVVGHARLRWAMAGLRIWAVDLEEVPS